MVMSIIDGKRYNTETATEVASWDNGLGYSDFRHCGETLYVTKKGAWFTCGYGGPLSRYARSVGSMTGGSRDVIRTVTAEDAREWLERHGETEALEQYFGASFVDA